MHKTHGPMALIVLAGFVLAGCALATPAAMPSATPRGTVMNAAPNAAAVGPDQEGGIIKLKVGDKIEVRIPTIPKQGYVWQATSLDAKILEQVGEPVYMLDTNPNAAGGIVTVTFKVIGPGTTPLTLTYGKPAQGSTPSLSSNSFGITVQATE